MSIVPPSNRFGAEASDPTAKLERMSVTVNGVKKTILLPQGEEAGRSIGVK